jgi:hypothetical protein
MITAVVTIVVGTIAIVVISIAIASIIGHFFIKGFQALLLYLFPPHDLSSNGNHNNEYQEGQSNLETIINKAVGYPFDIRDYDPCNLLHKLVKSPRPHCKAYGDNKSYERDPKRYLPRPSPRSVPLPIKHIGNIVNRLRRGVNQSGKEPISI